MDTEWFFYAGIWTQVHAHSVDELHVFHNWEVHKFPFKE